MSAITAISDFSATVNPKLDAIAAQVAVLIANQGQPSAEDQQALTEVAAKVSALADSLAPK